MKNTLAITAIHDGTPKQPLVLRGDLVQAVRDAAALGYTGLEIHVIDPAAFPTQDVLAACRACGVRIAAIVTGQVFTRRKLCITSPDAANRDAAMAELYRYIDVAAALEAADGVVIGWVKGNRPEGPQEAFDQLLADQLRKLGEYAQARGQRILVEVINRYETNLFNTAEELCAFLDRWSLPNCWVHLDTFHMNIEEADMAQAVRTAGARLGYLHVADSNRLYPGAGHIDFEPVLRAASEVGYAGSVSLECIPEPDGRTAAEQTIRLLKPVMDRIP